jgi:hypothetical protein
MSEMLWPKNSRKLRWRRARHARANPGEDPVEARGSAELGLSSVSARIDSLVPLKNGFSSQLKIHDDCNQDRHRLTILHCGLEAVSVGCLDGLPCQAIVQGPHYLQVFWQPMFIDDQS